MMELIIGLGIGATCSSVAHLWWRLRHPVMKVAQEPLVIPKFGTLPVEEAKTETPREEREPARVIYDKDTGDAIPIW